jgi:HD superfamily phosphohydrolase
MDYLLRDSHHLGVNYGKYDLHRLVSSVCAFETVGRDDQIGRVHIGVHYGGLHAAESLIIARYSMFKQVYFHKTRMAFDLHLHHVMSNLLPNGCFPTPDREGLEEYLKWDDWRVLGLLADGKGGAHAARMLERDQYRQAYRSKDRLHSWSDTLGGEKRKAELVREHLTKAGIEAEMKTTKNSWYKVKEGSAITVVNESNPKELAPLSEYTPIASLNADDQYFLYVNKADVTKAKSLIAEVLPEIEKLVQSDSKRSEQETPVPKPSIKKSVSGENEAIKQSTSVPTLDRTIS